jgi:hypothetical protein
LSELVVRKKQEQVLALEEWKDLVVAGKWQK